MAWSGSIQRPDHAFPVNAFLAEPSSTFKSFGLQCRGINADGRYGFWYDSAAQRPLRPRADYDDEEIFSIRADDSGPHALTTFKPKRKRQSHILKTVNFDQNRGAHMNLINHQFRLAARPVGLPKRTDWKYSEEAVADPGPGQLVIKVLYLSLDPAMRGWMNDARSYIEPVKIGDVMRAGGVGRVIASANPAFAVGDHVTGMLGVQEYATSDGKGLTKVNPEIGGKQVPLPVFISALGMPGLTAYFGLLDVGQAKAGDTVVVSGAAGAVGMVVGQIAKIKGCRVVGIAGGPEKCAYVVKELGFDACIDYKAEDVKKAIAATLPAGSERLL